MLSHSFKSYIFDPSLKNKKVFVYIITFIWTYRLAGLQWLCHLLFFSPSSFSVANPRKSWLTVSARVSFLIIAQYVPVNGVVKQPGPVKASYLCEDHTMCHFVLTIPKLKFSTSSVSHTYRLPSHRWSAGAVIKCIVFLHHNGNLVNIQYTYNIALLSVIGVKEKNCWLCVCLWPTWKTVATVFGKDIWRPTITSIQSVAPTNGKGGNLPVVQTHLKIDKTYMYNVCLQKLCWQ